MPPETEPERDDAHEPHVAHDADGDVVAFPSRPMLRDVIGEVLREERHEQGRTLADVAEAAAVSLQYLSEVERGTKDVSSDLLHAVHTALGLDLATVLERANQRLAVRSLAVRSQRGGGQLRMAA